MKAKEFVIDFGKPRSIFVQCKSVLETAELNSCDKMMVCLPTVYLTLRLSDHLFLLICNSHQS